MRRQREKKESELNLLPIMNLFVALIPFLLVGTAFYHMSVLNVSVPTNTDALDVTDMLKDKKKQNIKVVMTVQISKAGFKVFGMCEDLSQKELVALNSTINRRKNKYRYDSLSSFLSNVKRQYRKSDTVVIVPDKNVQYSILIKTIDAARKRKIGQKDRFLFTNVVVSSRV